MAPHRKRALIELEKRYGSRNLCQLRTVGQKSPLTTTHKGEPNIDALEIE